MANFEIEDMKETFNFRKAFTDVNHSREDQIERIIKILEIRGIKPGMARIERSVKLVETSLGFELHETFEVKAREDKKDE